MVNRFLRAKHWQIFLFSYAIPMVLYFVVVFFMIINIVINPNNFPIFIKYYFAFYLILAMIVFLSYNAWVWSVVTGLQKKIPDEIKMNLKWFKFFFFSFLICMLIFYFSYFSYFLFYINIALNYVPGEIDNIPEWVIIFFIIVFIIITLILLFASFYIVYFTAKTYKTAKLQRKVYFSDFVEEFFLIWFYYIGIWFIQPKINEMFEEKKNDI